MRKYFQRIYLIATLILTVSCATGDLSIYKEHDFYLATRTALARKDNEQTKYWYKNLFDRYPNSEYLCDLLPRLIVSKKAANEPTAPDELQLKEKCSSPNKIITTPDTGSAIK